ncbi:C1 family peptidase [Bifidobacterium sp. BRDM6]|uniref:Aminopeptidase n=2 Tax=Bifidobacterium choloepi TaxID=2614131 RepID=A0A6I5ND90_9BIFI|nr:C1 family peptidase [Bifidobacterium choloepi]NEG70510.1 C1 family peptidase [Bifidobacterium choloepi]
MRELGGEFGNDRANVVAANASTTNGSLKAATSFAGERALPRTFNTELKMASITNQRQSGRCWMFAGLNMLSYELMHAWNLDNFEFSETYLYYWVTLEKANMYLEYVIETIDEPSDSRVFQTINEEPGADGGWWQLFADLVAKYGLMPKDAFPECANSMDSGAFKQYLGRKLHIFAAELRKARAAGADVDVLRGMKDDDMTVVQRMVAINLGIPPEKFDVLLRVKDGSDDDKKNDSSARTGANSSAAADATADGADANAKAAADEADALGTPKNGTDERKQLVEHGIAPREFVKKYVPCDIHDFVQLCNCPMESTPYYKRYAIKYSRSIADAEDITFLNLPLDVFRKAAVDQLKAGHPVYFCCDCHQFALRKEGYFSQDVVRVDQLYGTDFALDKADSLEYFESPSNHAMAITGVEVGDDGEPLRWKIENSWGEDNGEKGFYVASADWFDSFVNEIIIKKDYLDDKALAALAEPAVEIEPWAPLSLACGMSD